ncbi:HEAT repeat domain-containing protein [Natronorubrum sulfidifaciens]|uniref:Uncharacterized protein n=1 Tax=Natronorubrum sulfidifaciens JCM 14089 TaxID=1230460 RepID=L9WGI9_9EURY|nr:hypothetical protein [Natronorubrum sulfidifaciens]ELY48391.1 hypothetical protein C495_02925 [Natronorubrum sulfidifaciens JCM 14089]
MTDPLVSFVGRFADADDRTQAAAILEEISVPDVEDASPDYVDDEFAREFTDALDDVVAELKCEDETQRRDAAEILYEVSQFVPTPLCLRGPTLVTSLDDPTTRPYIAGVLTTVIDHRDSVVLAIEAVRSDIERSPSGVAAIPFLSRITKQRDSTDEQSSLDVAPLRFLSWIAKTHDNAVEPVEPAVTAALEADDPAAREYGSRFFAVTWEHYVGGNDAVGPLFALTDDENPRTRANALTALGHRSFTQLERNEHQQPVDVERIVEAATAHLADADNRVRSNAAAVLSETEHEVVDEGLQCWPDYVDDELTELVVERLIDGLNSKHWGLQRQAARAVSGLERSCPDLLATYADALVEYGWTTDRPNQIQIKKAVAKTAKHHPDAFLPHARTFVESLDDRQGRWPLSVIEHIGTVDFDAVAPAVDLLVDQFMAPQTNRLIRQHVAAVLGSLYDGRPDAFPDWVEHLHAAVETDGRRGVRKPFVAIAQRDPAAAASVFHELCSRLTEPDVSISWTTTYSLGQEDPAAIEPAIDVLVKHVLDGDVTTAANAVDVLYGIVKLETHHDLLEPARVPIERRLDEFDGRTRENAQTILETVGGTNGE